MPKINRYLPTFFWGVLLGLMVPQIQAFDPIEYYIPNAKKVDRGWMSYYIWDLYDAKVYALKGTWKKINLLL